MAFTDLDNYYQLALARYNAKESYLIEKYQKLRESYSFELQALGEYPPSPAKDSLAAKLARVVEVLDSFLDDLKTPCDLFCTEFEMRSRK